MLIDGIVENIIYRNEENGYTVLLVNTGETVFTLLGNIARINKGEGIKADVTESFHEMYGEQYTINSYQIILASKGKNKNINRENEINLINELQKLKLGPKTIEKIIDKYGEDALLIIKKNPYTLALEIDGIGFNTCDNLAKNVGIAFDNDRRVEAAILYILDVDFVNGNVYVVKEDLIRKLKELLSIEDDYNIDDALYNLEIKMLIKTDRMDNIDMIFKRSAYSVEKKLSLLLFEHRDNITIITGGPGTGKTYNIKKYLNDAAKAGLKVALAAPTGRAAKRINELTGYEAKTIHRLLECVGDKDAKGERAYFNINEENKLDVDLLIVDEMSMVDEYLMYALIRSLDEKTAILLVGDVDQLPSVGAGQVLYDMIESGYFNVKRLDKIYRQDEGSHIIENAHMVNLGSDIDLKVRYEDFVFTHRSTEDGVNDVIKVLLTKNLPNHFGIDLREMQVICPSKKGKCGTEALNVILQNEINPEDVMKQELNVYGNVYRYGDKVMQTANNYNLPYDIIDSDGRICDRGVGVFNGDVGEIVDIDEEEVSMVIKYEDRLVYYLKEDMKDLSLAYAITVHKSQGSEYDVVLMPIMRAPSKLMTRKILYTAMTRARKCIIFIGMENYFREMLMNKEETRRNTALCSKLYLYDFK